MSEGFRDAPEELRHVLEQIIELRRSLSEIAGRLAQIERHVKRAFGVPPNQDRKAGAPRPPRAVRPALPPPTLSPAQALAVFDELSPLLENRGREAVERRLSSLEVSDLKLIAQEVGAPLPRKPSRRALGAVILGRVNESRLLSRNRNVRSSRSSEDEGNRPEQGRPL